MAVDTPTKVGTQELACASCQEQIVVGAFYARPFVQLCALNASKTLHYTYYQTYESQLKSLKNLKAATVAVTDEEEEKKQSLEAEAATMREQDTGPNWYENKPWEARNATVLADL